MYQAKLFQDEPQTSGGGTKIKIGIHADGDVTFGGVLQETGWSDILFLKGDRSIHKRLFTPSGASPKEGEGIKDALLREEERNLRAIVEVMRALLEPELVENFQAPDYRGFLLSSFTLLNSKKGMPVNLKVVPDWREAKYPDLPLSRFVEKHIPGKACGLFYTKTEIERFEKNQDKSGDRVFDKPY